MDERPIGIFDSGVGGLSILRQVRNLLLSEEVLFLADQTHVPYGPRSMDEVRRFAQGITSFLIDHGAKLVVVACNTASAAALHHLRNIYPTLPFVGMEPAVKPAARTSRTQIVGVLATPATFQGALFASVVERFAGDVIVLEKTLPGLVDRIEDGDLDGNEIREILAQAVSPLINQGVDTLILACTHYPFIIPVLTELVGPEVQVIDPSPAIAQQTKRLLDLHNLRSPSKESGKVTYFTSGNPDQLHVMASRLIGEIGETKKIDWKGYRIHHVI